MLQECAFMCFDIIPLSSSMHWCIYALPCTDALMHFCELTCLYTLLYTDRLLCVFMHLYSSMYLFYDDALLHTSVRLCTFKKAANVPLCASMHQCSFMHVHATMPFNALLIPRANWCPSILVNVSIRVDVCSCAPIHRFRFINFYASIFVFARKKGVVRNPNEEKLRGHSKGGYIRKNKEKNWSIRRDCRTLNVKQKKGNGRTHYLEG